MNRRETLVTLTALVATVGSIGLKAQSVRQKRVAILSVSGPAIVKIQEAAFLGAMRELGWIEAHNIYYDRVYTNADPALLSKASAELTQRTPDLIYAITLAPALAAYANARTIPLVFSAVNDPVGTGLVKSLARPGGNVTGVANIGWELGGKRLQLLAQLLPKVSKVGVMINPKNPNYVDNLRELKLIEQAAVPLKISVLPLIVEQTADLEGAMKQLAKDRTTATMTTHNSFFLNMTPDIVEITGKLRIPFVAHRSEMTEGGALMSYSALLREQFRRAAQLVDKVLKGMHPADIPVELPSTYELVINRATARSIGVSIPQTLLLQVDRVIE